MLLNAPAYNESKENLKKYLFIGSLATFALLVVLTFAGFISGHGWLFTNLPAEHKMNNFFKALEAKDYDKAYAIYENDPDWKQHPQKYKDYPIQEFTEDWTTESPVKYPITSHHVDISKTDGTGFWGTGIIVAVRVNGDNKLFMWVQRSDGTITFAPHEIEY